MEKEKEEGGAGWIEGRGGMVIELFAFTGCGGATTGGIGTTLLEGGGRGRNSPEAVPILVLLPVCLMYIS